MIEKEGEKKQAPPKVLVEIAKGRIFRVVSDSPIQVVELCTDSLTISERPICINASKVNSYFTEELDEFGEITDEKDREDGIERESYKRSYDNKYTGNHRG